MRTVGVIQARMGSSRFPGKALATLAGKPALYWVIARAKMAASLDDVIVATSTEERDAAIAGLAVSAGVRCIRGSEEDVLARFIRVLELDPCDVVVRLTGDCPLIDPSVIDRVRYQFVPGQTDYVSLSGSFPNGLDTEVVSRDALLKAHRECRDLRQRGHVTPFIYMTPGMFSVSRVVWPYDHAHLRWVLDTPEDYRFLTAVFELLEARQLIPRFSWTDVLEICEEHPDWLSLVSHLPRNVGWTG